MAALSTSASGKAGGRIRRSGSGGRIRCSGNGGAGSGAWEEAAAVLLAQIHAGWFGVGGCGCKVQAQGVQCLPHLSMSRYLSPSILFFCVDPDGGGHKGKLPPAMASANFAVAEAAGRACVVAGRALHQRLPHGPRRAQG